MIVSGRELVFTSLTYLEYDDLKQERHHDTARVLHQTHNVGLLHLESPDGEELADDGHHHQHHNASPVVATVRDTEVPEHRADDRHLGGDDDPGGKGEGGPVGVPHVPGDDIDKAPHHVGPHQAEGSVGHVVGVAGVGVTEDHGGLDHQKYPGDGEQEVEDLSDPALLLQEDAGEEGYHGRLDGGDHHHIPHREMSSSRSQRRSEALHLTLLRRNTQREVFRLKDSE